ncbi:DUF4091 domain-containing protein [Stanieria cyanosphaera]|nr:DUF4091 domain-containing protein [Stanieria cyanosphaera]
MERIGLNEQPNSKFKNTIELYAARGEYEAFQIVVGAPTKNVTNVNVSISDLSSANEQIISNKNITLYREHYLYIDQPSTQEWTNNLTSRVGWYADGLIPFLNPETGKDLTGANLDAVPFDLKSGENQPIWVDIFVPRNTKAGQYKGTYTVTSDRGKFTGEISLTVWNFELPLQPSLNSSFSFWEQTNQENYIELLQHKIMPRNDLDTIKDPELISQWGLTSVSLPFWSGANYHNCRMKPAPSLEDIRAAAERNQSNLLKYIYSVDEVDHCPQLYSAIKEWGKNIQQAGVKHLVVMTPVPEIDDFVDIWVVQPQWYDTATNRIKEAMNKGDQIWFYSGYDATYSPQWTIDSQPIDFRIGQGFISQSLGIKGVLYWRIDDWTDEPWEKVPVYVHGEKNFPGEGMLVYRGTEVGLKTIVPSMRLKWIREGVEDYEYIEILKQLGLEKWALQVARDVGADWRNWTKKPAELELARKKLGEKINQIYSQTKQT